MWISQQLGHSADRGGHLQKQMVPGSSAPPLPSNCQQEAHSRPPLTTGVGRCWSNALLPCSGALGRSQGSRTQGPLSRQGQPVPGPNGLQYHPAAEKSCLSFEVGKVTWGKKTRSFAKQGSWTSWSTLAPSAGQVQPIASTSSLDRPDDWHLDWLQVQPTSKKRPTRTPGRPSTPCRSALSSQGRL